MTLRFTGAALAAFVFAAPQALAAMATGEQITAAVSGNTIQGTMDPTGPYDQAGVTNSLLL